MSKVRWLVRAASTLPVLSLNAPSWLPGVDFSDHRNYWRQGFPAAMITDTAFFRNPHYHKKSDTIDTLDFPRMAQVVGAIYWALLRLSS